jgi:hypothetical protein
LGDREVSFGHRGIPFGTADLDVITQVEELLRTRFGEEIEIISLRTDERR